MKAPVLGVEEAYALWAASYPPTAHNALMVTEEKAMLGLLGGLAGQRLLDAGCGSGRWMRLLAERGATVVGCDLSRPMLLRATGAVARASVGSLPFADAAFDGLVSGLVLGHVPDLTDALVELARVTRPGGWLLASDLHPAAEALGWQRTFKSDGRTWAVENHVHHLSTWRAAAEASGWRVIEMAEPCLDPADAPPGARFDQRALSMPVVLALRLEKCA